MPTLEGSRSATASAAKPAADRIAVVSADLIKRQAARPRTLKTLSSSLHALFRKQLSGDELHKLLEALIQRGVVKVTDGKLVYELPKEA
jgi:Skp family chaperone for outer membrane proteins